MPPVGQHCQKSHSNALERGDLLAISPDAYRDCMTTVRTFTHRMGAAAKGGKRIVEISLYLSSAKKKMVDQIKGMKEKACLREMANLLTVPGRGGKEKNPRAPPGDDKTDSAKRLKTENPSAKVGDIKCYDAANPKNCIRLMALSNLTTGPQPCAPLLPRWLTVQKC